MKKNRRNTGSPSTNKKKCLCCLGPQPHTRQHTTQDSGHFLFYKFHSENNTITPQYARQSTEEKFNYRIRRLKSFKNEDLPVKRSKKSRVQDIRCLRFHCELSHTFPSLWLSSPFPRPETFILSNALHHQWKLVNRLADEVGKKNKNVFIFDMIFSGSLNLYTIHNALISFNLTK